MKNTIAKFSHAFRGIFYALTNDRSYRVQVYLIGAIVVGVFVLFDPLERWEVLFVLLAYTLMLVTELQNSAFEAALDRMHPERHDDIGRSKDMAAGAVLTASAFLLLVIGTLIVGRI
jgi:diacylglycerol kinase